MKDNLINKAKHANFEFRPWGGYVILINENNYKVKKLVINPGKRFSLQYHKKRTETWTVVKGKVQITVGDKTNTYSYGQTVSIPVGTIHRIKNTNNKEAEIIEVQTGTYFGEDDIVRLEDDFGRVN